MFVFTKESIYCLRSRPFYISIKITCSGILSPATQHFHKSSLPWLFSTSIRYNSSSPWLFPSYRPYGRRYDCRFPSPHRPVRLLTHSQLIFLLHIALSVSSPTLSWSSFSTSPCPSPHPLSADLPSPHCPVRLLARSQLIFLLHIALSVSSPALSPILSKSRWHASFHLVFGRPLFLFPCISALNTFLSLCSSSLLVTRPYQFNRLSVIFLEGCVTLVVPRMCSFLILYIACSAHPS